MPTEGFLSWDGTGADSFRVYLGTPSGGCQSLAGTTTSEFFHYNGLAANQQYEWRVEAVRSGCPTATTACTSFRTAGGQPAVRLSAIPMNAKSGTPVAILWSTENADSVTLEPKFGSQKPAGFLLDVPTFSTTYSLTATNASGSTTASVRVIITGGPQISVVVARPIALVQSPGVGGASDTFTLRNDGDTRASITLSNDGSFFTQSPASISLDTGASATVTVTGLPSARGVYEGKSRISGGGLPEGTSVPVSLIVTAGSVGGAAAEPVVNPIELRAEPGVNPNGTAEFRNIGTVGLTAVASSTYPWLIPQAGRHEIAVGNTAMVNFFINRAARPDGDKPLGAISGTLWLDFVGEQNQRGSSEVTVVDTAASETTVADPPPIAANERVYFLPGISNKQTSLGTLLTDVTIAYPFGARDLSVTRLYFTTAASSRVATFDPIAPNRSFTLGNIVTSVYRSNDTTGTLQVRSADAGAIYVSAQRVHVRSGGTVGGVHPVFRSDRAAAAGEATILAGIAAAASLHTDLYVQETAGTAARVRVEFLDETGRSIGGAGDRDISGFGLLELTNAAPPGSVTTIITNLTGSTGKIVAYALVIDDITGDQSTVVDDRRYYGYSRQESVIIPTGRGSAGAGGRHRAVPSASPSRPRGIDLAIFNPESSDAQTQLRIYSPDGELTGEQTLSLRPEETLVIRSVDIAGSILIVPVRGTFVASARLTRRDASGGTVSASLPTLRRDSGLAIGQSTIFAGLIDTRSGKTNGTEPALVLLETSGRAAKALVTLNLDGGHSPMQFSREYEVPPRHAMQIDRVVRDLIGPARDRDFPDLYNLNLEVHVLEGDGTIAPYVTTVDNRSGDLLVRFAP